MKFVKISVRVLEDDQTSIQKFDDLIRENSKRILSFGKIKEDRANPGYKVRHYELIPKGDDDDEE